MAITLLVAGGAYWVTRPDDDLATAPLPDGAPERGSCWLADERATREAMPWTAATKNDCSAEHALEVFLVSRVSAELVVDTARAKGEDARIRQQLMYAQARRVCTVEASRHLGGGWHGATVRILASWIRPTRLGYFGCALAVTTGPGGTTFVTRTGSLRAALAEADADKLTIACVVGNDEPLYVPCDTAHHGEYVGTYTITPMDAPFDKEAVPIQATKGCANTASGYIGSGARNDLRAAYVGPATAGDWLGSDQTFACYVMPIQGMLIGSLKDIGDRALPRP